MKIKSFTIKNYRSIKELKIDNLNPVNVFFGKNNVGKSNILRGLHLAFYCLRADSIFLPDTMFFNRNIYRPIQILIDLILNEELFNTAKVNKTLRNAIENIRSSVVYEETVDDITEELDKFSKESSSFKAVKKPHFEINLTYSEETTEVRISVKDLESNYTFDYGKYKILYERLQKNIRKRISLETTRRIRLFLPELSRLGLDVDEMYSYLRRPRGFRLGLEDMDMIIVRFERHITGIKENGKRKEALILLDQFRETLQELRGKLLVPFSNIFEIIKGYFNKISDNFVLIPNKEYFRRDPLDSEDGDPVQIFDIDRFMKGMLSLIDSPTRRERELIHKFYGIFNESYSNFGRLESITKVRDEIFIIFGTTLGSLPITEQGLGLQDLFIYLANMILFDPAIVAIEEPEGGLSTENQTILCNIIEKVYSLSDKQILISSHSEEFETPNSYIIEIGREGTKETGRMEEEKEYEEKIEKILLKRKMEEEKDQYEALLRGVTERQMTLDVLNYINNFTDEKMIDAQEISNALGYPQGKIQEVLKRITRKK